MIIKKSWWEKASCQLFYLLVCSNDFMWLKVGLLREKVFDASFYNYF